MSYGDEEKIRMFRRRFVQEMTWTGVGALAGVQAASAGERKTVAYAVKGFSCITCAVGLETMLRQHRGVFHAAASYPNENVRIEFDPNAVTEQSLHQYIAEMGFSVTGEYGK
jgi:copper chaperone CopZ